MVYRGVQNYQEMDTLKVGDVLDGIGYVVAFTDFQEALQEVGASEGTVIFMIAVTKGTPVRESGKIMLLKRHQLLKVDSLGESEDRPRVITVHTQE
jgi:hypothetical protein